MKWKSLFTSNDTISPEETRQLLLTSPPGALQLLDVRQPKEYEQTHIAGAMLIPLGELPSRLAELNPETAVIIYCRSGVRSLAGCQILTSSGFPRVLNMTGGILGWQGHQAAGAEDLGLDLFVGGDFNSSVSMAFAMEQGLGDFYQMLADQADNDSNRELLTLMARLEDGHMAKLQHQYPALHRHAADSLPPLEGGLTQDEFLSAYGDQLQTIEAILHTGMRFEAQAYDMYTRLAAREEQPALRTFYLQMAAEEQAHLRRLSEELDRRLT